MKKRKVKYFIDFLTSQEKWLNDLSHKGWKLTKTSGLFYEFEDCTPGEYEYHIEFVAHLENSERENYIDFLKDSGYNVLIKNINLNHSVCKMKWRPWANKSTQISTSQGNYNKELIIIERKKDIKPFELHTELMDIINYIKPIRNSQLFTSVLLMGLISIKFPWTSSNTLSILGIIILTILMVVPLLNSFKYSKLLFNYKKEAKIYE